MARTRLSRSALRCEDGSAIDHWLEDLISGTIGVAIGAVVAYYVGKWVRKRNGKD